MDIVQEIIAVPEITQFETPVLLEFLQSDRSNIDHKRHDYVDLHGLQVCCIVPLSEQKEKRDQ